MATELPSVFRGRLYRTNNAARGFWINAGKRRSKMDERVSSCQTACSGPNPCNVVTELWIHAAFDEDTVAQNHKHEAFEQSETALHVRFSA